MGVMDEVIEYGRRSGRNLGGLLDWLGGGARAGAEPTLALMRGDALNEPLLPTADSGGRIGAVASAITQPMVPGATPAGALGVYGGRLAKTANLDKLKEAELLAAGGADNEAVRAATGWFQGPDKQWRFEIPDDQSAVINAMPNVVDTPNGKVSVHKVGDALSHDELFAAYPELRNVNLYKQRLDGVHGLFEGHGGDPSSWGIRMNGDPTRRGVNHSTLLHELQHGIQEREGFATGGGEAYVNGLVEQARQRVADLRGQAQSRYWEVGTVDEPVMQALKQQIDAAEAELAHLGTGGFEGYQRLAGEIEARDVQARMDMSNRERAAQAPYASQGIPPDQMIIRGLLNFDDLKDRL